MSTALVAVADGNQVRGYHRGADGALTQVAQFLVATVVEPAELAAIVADLSDKFGWAEGQPPPPQARPARVLPAAKSPTPQRAAAPPEQRKKRYSPDQATVRAERAAILTYLGEHPNITRRQIGEALWPDATPSQWASRVQYRLNDVTDQLVITPGNGIEPDLLRLRNGDGP